MGSSKSQKKGHKIPYLPPLSPDRLKELRQQWKHVRYLVLDEISMIPPHMLLWIHLRLQAFKENKELFGGISVIAFGDLFQLQPPEGFYVFHDDDRFPMPLHIWRSHFLCFCLTHNFRAQRDPAFTGLLQHIRLGLLSAGDIDLLQGRVGLTPPRHASRLRARRKDVRRYNMEALKTLPATTKLEAVDFVLRSVAWEPDPTHSFAWDDEEDCGALPTTIHLGPGAEVILRSNINTMDGLTNGARGTVTRSHRNLRSTLGFIILLLGLSQGLLVAGMMVSQSFLRLKLSSLDGDLLLCVALRCRFNWLGRSQFTRLKARLLNQLRLV